MNSAEVRHSDEIARTELPVSPYVCPDCKVPLEELACPACCHAFSCADDGTPRLLSRHPRFAHAGAIADAYEDIYTVQSNVWENQGRTPEFIRYFSGLLDRFPGNRFLEIGCGEGFLLASVRRAESYGVELSQAAVRKARTRAQADFSLALSERLPFASDYFDLVTSVGVMEHFLDINEALQEIRRILKPGGTYVSLTHVDVSLRERLAARASEFIFPRPRPIRFVRWLKERSERKKLKGAFPSQPIQNRYTTDDVTAQLEGAGFTVEDVIHQRKDPDLPLAGSFVVIYVARK